MIPENNIYVHFIASAGPRLIHVAEVVEIIPMVLLDESGTAGNQSAFRGLFNYRGKIIPVFDIYADSGKAAITADQFLIVTSTDNKSIAIVASEVNQLVSVLLSDISDINPLGEKAFAVAKVEEQMIQIVNTTDFLGAASA